jgi:hypothetical protein
MSKLEYKPIAVGDSCFVGRILDHRTGETIPEITVLIKLKAEGKSYPYYKTDARTFPNGEALIEWIDETKVAILSDEEFRKLKTNDK